MKISSINLSAILEDIRSSYWFIPAVMLLGVALLATGLLEVDRSVEIEGVIDISWLYQGGSDGARQVLATTAASMLGLAGVSFSITIVSLTLAANQFGPRLLRTFMRDRANQFVLGAFTSTFLYCLLVLRAVRGEGNGLESFVPHLSTTVGVALAVLSIGVLVFFIHHVAAAIQAPNVVAAVSEELEKAIDHQFPDRVGEEPESNRREFEGTLSLATYDDIKVIHAVEQGYFNEINHENIIELAVSKNIYLELLCSPGKFMVEGDPLFYVRPANAVTEELRKKLERSVILNRQRSLHQDLLFPIDQLAEMAVRALSPGINDPYTAALCVEYLGRAIVQLALRSRPDPRRVDSHGEVRLIAHAVSVSDALNTAFDPIRDYGRDSVMVLHSMLKVFERIAKVVRSRQDREALASHVTAARAILSREPDSDRGRLRRGAEHASRILEQLNRGGGDEVLTSSSEIGQPLACQSLLRIQDGSSEIPINPSKYV